MTEFQSMASVDGVITPLGEAKIPITDRGFLFGDSVYEVFRTYRGVPLFYDEHWERCQNSARLIHMEIEHSKESVIDQIRATVQASGAAKSFRDVYVRYTVTRGEGALDLLPGDQSPTRLVVVVKEVPHWKPEFYSTGVAVAVVAVRRNPSESLDPNIKGGNYLNNVLGAIEANKRGADDCLMLNAEGLVTEASNSNVFFVINGELVTPSQSAANLRGLTKSAIHDACAADGLATAEVEVSREDVARATECFLSSATREVMPVAKLILEDGAVHRFPEGGGKMTRRVAALYNGYVDAYVAERQDLSMF